MGTPEGWEAEWGSQADVLALMEQKCKLANNSSQEMPGAYNIQQALLTQCLSESIRWVLVLSFPFCR